MADVQLIIDSMNTITHANYVSVKGGPPSSRPTGHQVAFQSLQGAANQIVLSLNRNRAPNRDQRENIGTYFDSLKKNVNVYCVKTAGTNDVLKAYNDGSTEWQVLVRESRG